MFKEISLARRSYAKDLSLRGQRLGMVKYRKHPHFNETLADKRNEKGMFTRPRPGTPRS